MRKVSFSYLPTTSSETCNRVCVYICVWEIKDLNDFARLDRFRGDFWGDFERLLIFRLFPRALCVGEITCEKCVDKVWRIELLCNGNPMTGWHNCPKGQGRKLWQTQHNKHSLKSKTLKLKLPMAWYVKLHSNSAKLRTVRRTSNGEQFMDTLCKGSMTKRNLWHKVKSLKS